MASVPTRRYRRRSSPSREGGAFKKETSQEQGFFGSAAHETFFQPAAVIHRKCEKCEEEDKKVHRAADKKEEEKVMRAEEKKEEEKVMRMEEKKEEKMMRKEEKEEMEEEKHVHRAENKEEEKVHKKKSSSGTTMTGKTAGSYISSINSKGSAMPKQEQHFFGKKMGYDFSNVKIHNDKEAVQSAKDIHAQAYAYGNNIVFNEGKYNPETSDGKRLMAHELAHVVQQGAAGHVKKQDNGRHSTSSRIQKFNTQTGSTPSNLVQRAGDPKKIPGGLSCPTSLAAGAPSGTDLLFANDTTTITGSHTGSLIGFVIAWLLKGGTDNILIHGFASTEGAQEHNWTLSCNRAEAVRSELIRLGVPPVRIRVVAHGASTDFGASEASNRRAVVSMTGRGFFPFITGMLKPHDDFAGRSYTRFGVGEDVDLDFLSFPPTAAADFGGLEWHLVSGGGTLNNSGANDGKGAYKAPAVASAVQLQLRVATGLLAGRVISSRNMQIVEPSGLRQVIVPGTSPNFGGWGNPPLAAGTWGVGFQANEFINPKDVSFKGVEFKEGSIAAVVSAGSLAARNGVMHTANSHGLGGGGNAATGTPLGTLGPDGVAIWGGVTPLNFMGIQFCGPSHFLWAIPLLYKVSGGAFLNFAHNATSDQHFWCTVSCAAIAEKQGAGPVCRNMNGTGC